MRDDIICRCEEITRAEIEEAIGAGAHTLSWVKRLTRAGMGMCQGRTCGPLIRRIIAEMLGVAVSEVPPDTGRPPVRAVPLRFIASSPGAEVGPSAYAPPCRPVAPCPEPFGRMKAEYIVVGGGSTGCSIAYQLARSGADVVLVERDEIAAEGSGRCCGGVRQHGRAPEELPLAMESSRMWDSLDQELGCESQFRRIGYLWVSITPEELRVQEEAVARESAHGLDVKLLDKRRVHELVPLLSGRVLGGSYCPSDGQADPVRVTWGYASAARRYGARIKTHTTALSLDVQGGRVFGLITDKGSITAPVVILATGPWTNELTRPLGITLPIKNCPNQIMVTQAQAPSLPTFIVSSVGICFQGVRGNVYIGNTNPPGVEGLSRATLLSEAARTASEMITILPMLKDLPVIRSWAGILDHTPDDIPIIGEVEELPGLFLATGFSGHGFALAPSIGKQVAEFLVFGRSFIDLTPFSPARFRAGRRRPAVRHFAHQKV